MADTKVSALTELAGASVVADDWIPIVDSSVTTTKKLNPLEIKDIPSLGLLKLAAGGASVEDVGAIESNVNTVAATGATETLDLSTYAVHDVTMDQNCAFTLSNPAPSTRKRSRSGAAAAFTVARSSHGSCSTCPCRGKVDDTRTE